MMSGGDPGQEVAGLERDTLLWLSGTTGVERGWTRGDRVDVTLVRALHFTWRLAAGQRANPL